MTAVLLGALLARGAAALPNLPSQALKDAGLAPRAVPDVPAERIELYMDKDDAWSAPVLAALPDFAAIGARAFGKDVPPVRLYLMSDLERYRAFTKAALGEERSRGTGNYRIVTMCLSCENRRPDETETTAVVLHEFGHAWMNTYLRDRHGLDYLSPKIRRPFLDEGLADYFADQWDKEFLARRRAWIVDLKVKRGVAAPALAELKEYGSFYDEGDRELHYWLSALLARRMLGDAPDAARKIPLYLDLMGGGKAPEDAFETATGKRLADEYASLVRELGFSASAATR